MISIFKTIDNAIHQIEEPEKDCWISLIHPDEAELHGVADRYAIDIDDLRAALDEEERSRIEVEPGYTLVLVDIPKVEKRDDKERYVTQPLGILLAKEAIITVCLEDTPILSAIGNKRTREFHTHMKTRFVLQILYRNASLYLQYLRAIDRASEMVERKLHGSTKNRELIELLELEKSLVYFTTSLRGNEVVFEKLLKNENIKKYPEDTDLLEGRHRREPAGHRDGEHLQRHPERDDGRVRVGHLQQSQHRDEVPGGGDDRPVGADADLWRLRHERVLRQHPLRHVALRLYDDHPVFGNIEHRRRGLFLKEGKCDAALSPVLLTRFGKLRKPEILMVSGARRLKEIFGLPDSYRQTKCVSPRHRRKRLGLAGTCTPKIGPAECSSPRPSSKHVIGEGVSYHP